MAILAQRPSHKVRANPVVALLLLSRYPTRVENPSRPDPRIGKIGWGDGSGSGQKKKDDGSGLVRSENSCGHEQGAFSRVLLPGGLYDWYLAIFIPHMTHS